MSELINSNPVVLDEAALPRRAADSHTESDLAGLRRFALGGGDVDLVDDDTVEEVDAQEIFDLIANVQDPEHPLTLGQLNVVGLDRVRVSDSDPAAIAHVAVEITPTITHCSLATLIGLGLKVRLDRSLSPRFRTKLTVTPGSHQSEKQVNKQLNDKERVAAATDNAQLLKVVEEMLVNC